MTTMAEQDLARLIAALASLKTPFDRKQISRLPASDKRPALDYVNHAHVTNRLNQYAPDCSWVVDEMFTQNGECWIRGTMTIYGASRVEFGKGKNPLEAMSHFIRRAAMRFGVATDLWAKEDFETAESSAPVTSAPPNSKPAVAQGPDRGTGADPSGPASPVDHSEDVSLDGAVSDADSVPLGGAGAESATLNGTDEPASQEQWHRLLQVVGGSKAKAVNRLNKANKTSYTTASSIGATSTEVANAITGGTE